MTIMLALLAAIGLGYFIKHDPGLVVIKYSGTVIQAPFSVFVVAMIVIVFALFFFFSLAKGLIRLPRNFRRWQGHRRYRRSEKFLSKGMLAMVEGNWRMAETSFKKGAVYSHTPMVNYLGAARAAQQLGHTQRRDHYLRLAHDFSAESNPAVSLTQAELQLEQKQTEQAYATLRHLDSEQPGLDQVKLMLLEASTELKDWDQMLELLGRLEKKGLLPTEQVRAKQLSAYAGLLRQAGKSSSREALDIEWNKIPGKLQREPYLLEVYVEERLWFSDTSDCEPLVRQSLKKKWDANLVRLYGAVEGAEPAKQLAFAEKQLAEHINDPVLLLTLGCLAKRNSLWGKARNYLEESIAIEATPEAYRQLAGLLERQGEYSAAAVCYQEGLEVATNRAPNTGLTLLNKHESIDDEKSEPRTNKALLKHELG